MNSVLGLFVHNNSTAWYVELLDLKIALLCEGKVCPW